MATGRQIKRKASKARQHERGKKTVMLLDALTDKVLELENRVNELEELLEGAEIGQAALNEGVTIPISSFGLKNEINDFPEPVEPRVVELNVTDKAVVHDQAEVVTYLPEDDDIK